MQEKSPESESLHLVYCFFCSFIFVTFSCDESSAFSCIDYISFQQKAFNLNILFIALKRILLIFSIEKMFSAHFEHSRRIIYVPSYLYIVSSFFQILVNTAFGNIAIFSTIQKSSTKFNEKLHYRWTKECDSYYNNSIAKRFLSKWNRLYSFVRSFIQPVDNCFESKSTTMCLLFILFP